MSRDEVMERLEQLGWEPAATMEHTLLEKKSILHELGQSERVRRTESKEQDRAERSVQGPQHSIVGTRDETTADKEDQRGTSRTRTIATGNPEIRTTPREDGPRQSVLRVSGADTRRGRSYSVATAEEVSVARGTRKTSLPRRKLHSPTPKLEPKEELADLVKRVEHLQATVRQRKTTATSSTT